MNKAEKAKYEDLLRKVDNAINYAPPSYFDTDLEIAEEKIRYKDMYLDNIKMDILIHLQIFEGE